MSPITDISPLNDSELARLNSVLDRDFVPHLPPLLPHARTTDDVDKKQRSRALSAFALASLCKIAPQAAAAAVVDDFEDGGIDACYLRQTEKQLWLVQGKLKKGTQFKQEEAQAFASGVRRLTSGELTSFNQHIQNRTPSVEEELDSCCEIILVVAHVGSGISEHARAQISELTADRDQDEKRFLHPFVEFGPAEIRLALNEKMAHRKINRQLRIFHCRQIKEPHETWIGLMPVNDLASIHQDHGDALFDRNIRNPLGHQSPVNKSIYKSLEKNSRNFFYLNNGITALADKIEPKSHKNNSQRIDVQGLTIINGAQTISTATRFKAENPTISIDDAKVSVTIIAASSDGDFGKSITQARNYQNAVSSADFAAVQEEQERLRRELMAYDIDYAYKARDLTPTAIRPVITIEEAAFGLALLGTNPFNPWNLRTKQDAFRTPGSEEYRQAFPVGIASEKVANAAIVGRALSRYIREQISTTDDAIELEILRHSAFAHGWVLAKRFRGAIEAHRIVDGVQIAVAASAPADALRQIIVDVTRSRCNATGRRPWIEFRNKKNLIDNLKEIMILSYNNTTEEAILEKQGIHLTHSDSKRRKFASFEYPKALFDYLCERAPQIGI